MTIRIKSVVILTLVIAAILAGFLVHRAQQQKIQRALIVEQQRIQKQKQQQENDEAVMGMAITGLEDEFKHMANPLSIEAARNWDCTFAIKMKHDSKYPKSKPLMDKGMTEIRDFMYGTPNQARTIVANVCAEERLTKIQEAVDTSNAFMKR
jgi:hypothetical protein